MIKFLIFVFLTCIGGALLAVSHWEAKTFRVSAFISSRAKHLIGLLFIFAGLIIFVSQFLIYARQ